jgi:MtN3 and saliva related transmembrane protein
MNAEVLGFIAGGLVSISLLPQVIKSIKTRSTNDISLLWMSINLLGQILWVAYGVVIGSIALWVMSAITFIMAITLFVLKLRFDT